MKLLLQACLLFIACNTFLVAEPTSAEKSAIDEPTATRIEEFLARTLPGLPKDKISIKPLSGGYSDATNFLIEADGKRYVLRMHKRDETEKRIQREFYALHEASKAGICPHLYSLKPDDNAVLMEYIEGKTITIEQAKLPNSCRKIAKALRTAHAIKRNPNSRSSTIDRIEAMYTDVCKYLKNKDSAHEAIQIIRKNSEVLSKMHVTKVNLHGDLNPRNIFITEHGVRFIDWFNTNWEDPFYDLCCFALLHDYNDKEEDLLLECYLHHTATPEDKRHYKLVKEITLANFCLTGHLIMAKLLSVQPQKIDSSSTLKGWSYYVQAFANNDTELTAQIFCDWAKCALTDAQKSINHSAE
jgi:tRNA A-37 threonylcarbamoyl transferase component Bud32